MAQSAPGTYPVIVNDKSLVASFTVVSISALNIRSYKAMNGFWSSSLGRLKNVFCNPVYLPPVVIHKNGKLHIQWKTEYLNQTKQFILGYSSNISVKLERVAEALLDIFCGSWAIARGSYFISNLMCVVCRLNTARQFYTTPYNTRGEWGQLNHPLSCSQNTIVKS